MEQDFYKSFKWRYYDEKTVEAVIVLCEGKKKVWRSIRVYDSMWLVNLSEKDVDILYWNQILFDARDISQDLRF
ncbi:hypothetical protein Hanom_Chr05g00398761 [Helianthus anomalus]